MNKIKRGLLLFFLISYGENATAISNTIFVDRMLISNSSTRIFSDVISPGKNVALITNKDDVILYYADIGVINSTQKKYNVEIICIDKKGNVVIQGSFKRTLDALEKHVGTDTIKSTLIVVTLDPKPNAMAPGQIIPLTDDNDYYIKLFVEKKLIGVTTFHYEIEK